MSFELEIEKLNPNHYMAAVGLHMVADAIDPGALLHFGPRSLYVGGAPTLRDVLHWLKNQTPVRVLDDKSSPVGIGPLVVSWQELRPRLRPWGGPMDTTSMTVEMLRALRVDDTDPLHSFAKVHPQPPGFDIGRSAVAQPRDLGYRTGDADFKFRPTLELLCFLGLQRFNPVTVTDTKDGGTYQFHVWGEPLPVSLVPAASCGILGGVEYLGAYTFQTFHVIDQPGYYAFTSANPI